MTSSGLGLRHALCVSCKYGVIDLCVYVCTHKKMKRINISVMWCHARDDVLVSSSPHCYFLNFTTTSSSLFSPLASILFISLSPTTPFPFSLLLLYLVHEADRLWPRNANMSAVAEASLFGVEQSARRSSKGLHWIHYTVPCHAMQYHVVLIIVDKRRSAIWAQWFVTSW